MKKLCSSEKSLKVGVTGFDFRGHQLFTPCYGVRVTLKQNWHRKTQFLVDFTISLLPPCPRSGTSIFWPKEIWYTSTCLFQLNQNCHGDFYSIFFYFVRSSVFKVYKILSITIKTPKHDLFPVQVISDHNCGSSSGPR